MENIKFISVLPDVFAGVETLSSEIWSRNVTFEKGKSYLVEADSGCGKSTFCSYILGYRRDYSGQICFESKDVRSLSVSDWTSLRRSTLSYMFQELRLFPELTAYENVAIKNNLTGFKSRQQIEEWFDILGISDKLHSKVGQMSFGQQQRVALMRALVQPFDFLLADEPVSHLDDRNSHIMGEILMREVKAQGAGVIITSIGKQIDLEYDKIFRL